MRLIDADELKKKAYPFPCAIGTEYAVTLRDIDQAPTIDAVPMDFHERCMQSEIKKRILTEKTNRQILENYVPVVHGRFEKQPEEIIPNLHVCPVLCKTCGTVYFTLNKSGMKELFCPYCGAKKEIGGQNDG